MSTQAQDIIFFKDGTKDSAKVLEVGHKVISYKKYKRLNGPTYTVNKSEVVLIEFEDGEVEVIESEPEKISVIPQKKLFGRNIVTLNLFSLPVGNVHAGYENISKNGHFGIKANLTASFVEDFLGLYALGPDFNFYSNGQKQFNYFFGPAIRVGVLEYEGPFASVLFNNGISYSAKSGFYISTQLGLGPALYLDEGLLVYGFWMFNLGGRF